MSQLSPVPMTRAAVRWSLGHALPRTLLAASREAGGPAWANVRGHSVQRPGGARADPRRAADAPARLSGQVRLGERRQRCRACPAVQPRCCDLRSFRLTRRTAVAKLPAWAMKDAPLGPLTPPSLLVTEPPDHTRYRKLVSRVFSVRAVEKLRGAHAGDRRRSPRRRSTRAVRPTSCAAYCSLLPVTVIAEILGVPEKDREKVLRFGAAAAPSLDLGIPWREFRQVEAALREFDEWLTQHLGQPAPEPGRRPAQPARRCPGGRGRAHRRGAQVDGRAGARGRLRDHRQPARQRHRAARRRPRAAQATDRERATSGPTRSTRCCASTRRCCSPAG